ncbi:hypothetical protein EGW08_017127, partial [Elysia chlorotica]
DRHLAKSSERKLNASHSSELLDSSSSSRVTVSSVSSSNSSSSSTQLSSSSAISSKPPSSNGPTPQPKSSASLKKSKTIDSSSVLSTKNAKNVSGKTSASGTAITSSLKSKEKDDSNKGKPPKHPKRNIRRVSIPDVTPEVIGEDGGLDNLVTDGEEGEVTAGEEADQIYLSLTDEEKQFALLALGNTVWNSDTRNLQVELSSDSRRACREFEDLQVEELFAAEGGRFTSLVDCDKVKAASKKNAAPSFGTFPQAVGSSRQALGKIHIAEIKFEKTLVNGDTKSSVSVNGSQKHNGLDSDITMKRNDGSKESFNISDITESLYETIPDDIEPAPSPKSAPRGRASAVSTNSVKGRDGGSSASNSSERGGGPGRKSSPQSQTMSPPPRTSTKMVAKKITLPPRNEGVKDNGFDDSVDSATSDDLNSSGNSCSLNDSTAMEGFRAIALLNDVLRDYADLNESSTDDFFSDAQSTVSSAT